MADFTGFYLGDIHSSTYGILRTSDGDRYTEGLIPNFEDSEVDITGGDGSLYAGRKFKKVEFTIPIAFDHMTEKQMREMRQWLGSEKLQPFRFDERPYKTYWVKLAERPELEYVCFMEYMENSLLGEKERIYKGEGKLKFVAYDPFGYCINEKVYLSKGKLAVKHAGINWQELAAYDVYNLKDPNAIEWAESSGLKSKIARDDYQFTYPDRDSHVDGKYVCYKDLYNPGDFDVDFQLTFNVNKNSETNFSEQGLQVIIYIYPASQEEPTVEDQHFIFKLIDFKDKDIVLLDTKKHLLMITSDSGTGISSVRYDLVHSAIWPKIPRGEWKMKISFPSGWTEPKEGMDYEGLSFKPGRIKYNYKYY